MIRAISRIVLLGAALGWIVPVQAQPVGTTMLASGAVVQGPADIGLTFSTWYGEQLYSRAYAAGLGNVEIVCTAAFASCETETFNADGSITYGSIATACTTTCLVQRWYNQTGSGQPDAIAASAGVAPAFIKSTTGGHACAKFNATTSQMLAIASNVGLSLSQPYTSAVVYISTSPATNTDVYSGRSAGVGAALAAVSTSANVAFIVASGTNISATAADNSFHVLNGIFDGASSSLIIDNGTPLTGSLTVLGSGASGQAIGNVVNPGTHSMTGSACAAGQASGHFSAGNITALTNLLRTFWGF